MHTKVHKYKMFSSIIMYENDKSPNGQNIISQAYEYSHTHVTSIAAFLLSVISFNGTPKSYKID